MDCLFCKIVQGEIPSQRVHETDELIAFKDINPQAPTHLLIVPKKHIHDLAAATEEDLQLLGRVQLAARDLGTKLGLNGGYRLLVNNGRGAGQSVFHLHYHLLGGRRLTWPPG